MIFYHQMQATNDVYDRALSPQNPSFYTWLVRASGLPRRLSRTGESAVLLCDNELGTLRAAPPWAAPAPLASLPFVALPPLAVMSSLLRADLGGSAPLVRRDVGAEETREGDFLRASPRCRSGSREAASASFASVSLARAADAAVGFGPLLSGALASAAAGFGLLRAAASGDVPVLVVGRTSVVDTARLPSAADLSALLVGAAVAGRCVGLDA